MGCRKSVAGCTLLSKTQDIKMFCYFTGDAPKVNIYLFCFLIIFLAIEKIYIMPAKIFA